MTAPILFAMEEFPELREIVEQGFDDPANVEMVCIESVHFFVPSTMLFKYLGCEMFITCLVGPQIPFEKSGNREDKVTCC